MPLTNLTKVGGQVLPIQTKLSTEGINFDWQAHMPSVEVAFGLPHESLKAWVAGETATSSDYYLYTDGTVWNGTGVLPSAPEESSSSAFYQVYPATNNGSVLSTSLASTTGAELVGGVNGTVATMLDQYNTEMNRPSPLAQMLVTGGLIWFGLDSLTEGAGTTNYVRHVKTLLAATLGYGGPGYFAADQTAFAVEAAQSFNATGTYTNLRDITMATVPANYSPNGRGTWWSAATGVEVVNANPQFPWTSVRVFYLIQPSGGTFNTIIGGTTVAINSSGTLGLGIATGTREQADASSVQITAVTGNVCIFGYDFVWDKNPTGIRCATMAQGGKRIQDFAGLDPTMATAWKTALNPGLVVINGGTNDISQGNTPQQAADYLTSYLSMILPTGSQAIIVEPNETGKLYESQYSTLLEQLRLLRISIAKTNDWYYYDERRALGNYNNAVANGWMIDDTHPQPIGNKIRASCFAHYLGLKTVVPADFSYPPLIIARGSIAPIHYDFPTVTSGTAPAGSQRLWRFGVTGSGNPAHMFVRVDIMDSSNTKHSKLEAELVISNSSSNDDYVTGIAIKSQTWTNWDNDTTMTPTLTTNITSSAQAEVYLSTTGTTGTQFVANGYLNFLYKPRHVTQSVWLDEGQDSLLNNFIVP